MMKNSASITWHFVCGIDDIEEEDVVGIDIDGKLYALYQTPSGYYATDGLCTHEQARLADGLVTGEFIECPKHNARFHIPSGKVKRVPAKVDLQIYPVKSEEKKLYIGLSGEQ
jgi:3-phenylpropionate/trans-cinnamate dioxygenase ferredoxin subunit